MIDVETEDTILRVFILFVQTARAALKYADTHLYREVGFSAVKLVVLQVLASNNGTMTPSQIAKWTHTERHNITTLVERMRQNGLVITERNAKDKRVVNVTLTDKGRELLCRAMPAAREVVNQVMLSITEGDAALLEKPLSVLRQNAYHGLEIPANHRPPLPD